MRDTVDTKKYISIGEFTKGLKEYLEGSFPYVFLRGEISNFRPASSGHWYFSLKDQNATIRAIVFKNSQPSIMNALNANSVTAIKDGLEVLVEGRISLYERSGDYSIIITKMIPKGAGELSLKFEMLKQKLLEEGLFDPSLKKTLPLFPSKIGIVTSPTGAALKDILNVLSRRFASIKITVFPAMVQGESAKHEIANAIKYADHHYVNELEHKCDALIIARGGGSIEDLWAFNEEKVAYAIHNAKIPIITGIGHEIDFTIADFCADLRAPTPSAAAEIVVKNSEDLINSIASIKFRIEAAYTNFIESLKNRMERCKSERLALLFKNTYENNLQDFSYLSEKLNSVKNEYFTKLNMQFGHLAERLESLSPLKTLTRGYSLVLDKNNNLVRTYKQLSLNDELSVILSEGELNVKVHKILEKSDKI